MNDAAEHLALRRQLLLARSALCRVRIGHELDAVRHSLSWARVGVMTLKALPIRSAVFGLALYGVTRTRLARFAALGARMLLLARLASIAVGLSRKPV